MRLTLLTLLPFRTAVSRLAGAGIAAAALLQILPATVPQAVGQGAAEQGAPGVSGLWLDNEGKAAVEVKVCGAEICGSIAWLRDPLNPLGKPWTDIMNADRTKRTRPVCGLQIIGGLKHGGNGLWKDGWIYDPEEGKQFNVELSLANDDTLKVFGYAGIRLVSETLMWKRLPPDSARCKGA